MSVDTSAPLVTLITASFNSSRTLQFTLHSLLNQDFQAFEAWVVGDACTDESETVVTSFGDRRLHWTNLPENSGSQGAPNNEGLQRARGRYIAYLGHDDLWFPWHLSGLLSFIEGTGADFVHAICARYGPRGALLPSGPLPLGHTYANQHVAPSSVLHRRDIVEDCGWWGRAQQLSRPVDMDFIRRVYLAGKRIECSPQLSVVKFPSAQWRPYAPQSELPQERYWRAMRADPEELHQRVFREAFFVLAQSRTLNLSVCEAVSYAFRLLGRRIIDFYGRERWPLTTLLYWKFQSALQQRRRVRGIAP